MNVLAFSPTKRPASITYPSPETRAHYFAVVRAAWLNLPEGDISRFGSDRHLRQHCLIVAGYCTRSDVICPSADVAIEVAARARPSKAKDYVLTNLDLSDPEACIVSIFEAKSQTAKALPADAFAALKERVFIILAEMLGVDPIDLSKRAGEAA